MGDFTSVTKYLDIYKSRKATRDEAVTAIQPFDKYYEIRHSRDIKKIFTYLVIDPHTTPAQGIIQGGDLFFRRLVFQYNVSLDKDFYFLNVQDIKTWFPGFRVLQNCTVCVKWREGTTVYRYALSRSATSDLTFYSQPTNFPFYTNQKIGKNFVIEVWGHRFPDFHSIPYGFLYKVRLQTSILSNPDVPEKISIDVPIAPFLEDINAIAFGNLPHAVPFAQDTIVYLDN